MRVMPPRSDDWAGILGVFVAGLFWFRRNQMRDVASVMSYGFLWGGISFASVRMVRYLLQYPGHPWRFPDGVPEAWAHYQSANWHSVMEQMHGFGFGIVVAVTMGMLVRRQQSTEEAAPRDWSVAFSIWFSLFVVGYLNLHKIVGTWVENNAVPIRLKAPFVASMELSALGWFRVVWWSAAGVAAFLLCRHLVRRAALVPRSWLGKSQWIYILFLWMMVIGNLQRAIPGFSDNRMVTEWILFMNACVATLLIVLVPSESSGHTAFVTSPWPRAVVAWTRDLAIAVAIMGLYGFLTLALYQQHLEGKPWANHRRFGPEAKWRIDPILKHGEHP